MAPLKSGTRKPERIPLSDNGSPPLTTAETNAINAQISYAASKVPGVKQFSKPTYSTCAADAGVQ